MGLTLWIEVILFVVLLGMSGFFSSSETSLFSLSDHQLEQMRRDGNARIGLIEKMLSAPRRLIVTILIGNEFVNVAASVISAAIIIKLLGAENKLINLFVMVPLLLLVGEITPKTLAIQNNVAFATFQSKPIDTFARLITPLRWIIRLVADWFTTLIVGKERAPGSIVTQDMVRTLAREAVGDGVLDRNEAQYIEQIFDFGAMKVEDVMTARPNVVFLPESSSLKEVFTLLHETRHSKLPVYKEHRDEIVGILHARDLLGADVSTLSDQPGALASLLRDPYFVPETKSASELFGVFRKRKLSVALTVDEYGGVTGLVTMEDLVECIFGDLPSPSDQIDDAGIIAMKDGTHEVDGSTPIERFNEEFSGSLEANGADTIGGLLLNTHGELPPEGTKLTVLGFEFEIRSIENNRIEMIAVRSLANSSNNAEGALPKQDADDDSSSEGDLS